MSSRIQSTLLAIATLFAGFTGTAMAQDYRYGWDPRSGDVWVDDRLSDVNRYGSRYREPFIDEIVRYHGAPRDLVSELLVQRRWAPGDVYYACAIASIIGRPCRTVVDEWDRDHGQGWGNVAQRLGIKPGSAEFHRLKRGFVPTYDRWARPITLDDDLRRHYPNRDKGASSMKASGKAKAGSGHGAAGKRHDAAPAAKADAAGKGKADAKGNGNKGNGKGKGGGKD
ncbi:hypothetical protein ACFQZQ_06380 [Lysobacter koreensis]|uniref:Uncharacterized protein n=1 Tax=Lysobacter koreensis TaxID=266122 RepID=A0ABW2YKU4_9GAMM